MRMAGVVVIFSLSLTCLAEGQNASPKIEGQTAGAEAAITALERQVCEAYSRKDTDALGRLLANDFVLLVSNSGLSDRTAMLDSLGRSQPTTCQPGHVRVGIYADVAWAYTLPVFSNSSTTEQLQVMDIWVRHDGQWQVALRNSTRLDPKAYLEHALDLMQQNSLRAATVDWPELRMQTLERAAAAEIAVDTYDAIRFALSSLGDHHSQLHLPAELEQEEVARNASRPGNRSAKRSETQAAKTARPRSPYINRRDPEGHVEHFAGKEFACVAVPKCLFYTPSEPEFVRFETHLQHIIAQLDASHPSGWVIDLRGNVGETCGPC